MSAEDFQYLSPTTFIKYLNCEEQVRLLKVEKVLPKNVVGDQTIAMACGTAFDAMVKCLLNKRFKLQEILDTEIQVKNRTAIKLAEALLNHYKKGPLEALKKEGIGYGGVDQECELEWTDRWGKKWVSGCRGKPDMVLTDGTVIDWKVNGAFSSWGAKPAEGWTRCFIGGKDLGTHIRSLDTMENVNRDWATQIYLYARLLGHVVGKPLRAGIEQVAVTAENEVYCASFRNKISESFQAWCEERFHHAFHALKNQKTPVPHYHDQKCIRYKKLCEVANFCESYKQIQKRVSVSGQSLLSPSTGNTTGMLQPGDPGFSFAIKPRMDSVQSDSAQSSDSNTK